MSIRSWRGWLLIAAVCVFFASAPMPGRILVPPAHVDLVASDGSHRNTGLNVMVAYSRESPRVVDWVVRTSRSAIPAFFRVAEDGHAGDESQRQARVSAWYAAQKLVGGRVGYQLLGSVPEGLVDGDAVVAVDGEPVTVSRLSRALTSTDGLELSWQYDYSPNPSMSYVRAAEAAPPVRLSVVRSGRLMDVSVRRASSLAGVELREWTEAPNPWIVRDLTGVRGPSAGLGLAVAYVAAAEGVDVTGSLDVAVTGALRVGPSGLIEVEEIGRLDDKIEAAVAAGMDLAVVPVLQAEQAREFARGRIDVVGVPTVHMAIRAICTRSAACPSVPGSRVWVD